MKKSLLLLCFLGIIYSQHHKSKVEPKYKLKIRPTSMYELEKVDELGEDGWQVVGIRKSGEDYEIWYQKDQGTRDKYKLKIRPTSMYELEKVDELGEDGWQVVGIRKSGEDYEIWYQKKYRGLWKEN